MAYSIKKTENFRDEIDLTEGDARLTVNVDINTGRIMGKFQKLMQKLAEVQATLREYRKAAPESEEQNAALAQATAGFGSTIVALFELIFGADQTQALLDFYQGDHAQLLADFLPYFSDVIVPEIAKRQDEIARKYKNWSAK